MAVCQVEFNGTITLTVAFQCFLFTVFTFGSWTECDTKNESPKEVERSSIKTEKYNSDGAPFRRPEFERHLCSNVKDDQFLRSDFSYRAISPAWSCLLFLMSLQVVFQPQFLLLSCV